MLTEGIGTASLQQILSLSIAVVKLYACARRDFLRSNEDEQAIFSLVRNTARMPPTELSLLPANALLLLCRPEYMHPTEQDLTSSRHEPP